MNRKIELLIGSLILIVIIGFVFVKSFDKDKNLGKLETALIDKDIDYLEKYIRVEGLDRDLDKEEIKDIVENLDSEYIKELKNHREDDNIYIFTDGKEKFIYNKYYLGLKTYELIVEPSYEEALADTKVIIDGEEVGKIKEDEDFIYKKLIPGPHDIKFVKDSEFGKVEKEEKIVALNFGTDNSIYLDGYIPYQSIKVESNLKEAELYVDGKNTGINIYDGYKIEPLNEDADFKIKAVSKIDGKEHESDEVNIKDIVYAGYYEFIIDYNNENDEESKDKENNVANGDLLDLMEGYQRGFVDAVNNNSYSYIEGYIEDGSSFMKAQKDLIKDLNKRGITEELTNFSIDDITDVSEEKILMTVTEKHRINYKDGTTKNVENKWEYTIISNQQYEYLIRDLKKAN